MSEEYRCLVGDAMYRPKFEFDACGVGIALDAEHYLAAVHRFMAAEKLLGAGLLHTGLERY